MRTLGGLPCMGVDTYRRRGGLGRPSRRQRGNSSAFLLLPHPSEMTMRPTDGGSRPEHKTTSCIKTRVRSEFSTIITHYSSTHSLGIYNIIFSSRIRHLQRPVRAPHVHATFIILHAFVCSRTRYRFLLLVDVVRRVRVTIRVHAQT